MYIRPIRKTVTAVLLTMALIPATLSNALAADTPTPAPAPAVTVGKQATDP